MTAVDRSRGLAEAVRLVGHESGGRGQGSRLVEVTRATTTPSQEVAGDGPMSVTAWFNQVMVTGDPHDPTC